MRDLFVYISSSWKNRTEVRALANTLRRHGHVPYDFTDLASRRNVEEDSVEIPPERFTDQFDPMVHDYAAYLDRPEWRKAVRTNRIALRTCDVALLLLPCGADAHADWAYAVGADKRTAVIGHPPKGERTPSHLWADRFFKNSDDPALYTWLAKLRSSGS